MLKTYNIQPQKPHKNQFLTAANITIHANIHKLLNLTIRFFPVHNSAIPEMRHTTPKFVKCEHERPEIKMTNANAKW